MTRSLPFSIFWLLAFMALLAWALMSPSFLATLEVNRGVLLVTASELGNSNDDKESQQIRAKARTHFERVLEEQPTDWRAYSGLGMLAKWEKDESQAITYWEQALKNAPQAQPLQYWLGMAYEANGEHEQALQMWRKGQAASKFTIDGDYFRKAQKLEAARASYQLALAVNPEAEEAKEGLEKVLRQLSKRLKDKAEDKEALSLLTEVIKISPRANDFVQLGDHERKAEYFAQARDWYERGEALYPQDAAISQRLGLLALQEGEVRKAEKLSRRAISFDPDYIQAYTLLARSLLQQGRLQEAEEIVLQGLERRSENAPLYARLGDIHKRQKRINEAKAAYQRALDLSPEMEYAQRQMQKLESK